MAEASIGSLKQIAISPEASRGTYAAPVAGEWLKHGGAEFTDNVENVVLKAGAGRIENTFEHRVSKEMADGGLNLHLGVENSLLLNHAIFGAGDESPTGTGPYVFSYTVQNDNEHESFTIAGSDPTRGYLAYTNAMLNDFTFSSEANGEFIQAETTWTSNKSGSQSAVTPAYSTTEEFYTPDQLEIKAATTFAGIGAADTLNWRSCELTINKNLDPVGAGGTKSGTTFNQNTYFSVSGNIVVRFDSVVGKALHDAALAGETRAIEFKFNGNTSGYYTTYTIPNAALIAPELPNDLDAITEVTINFEGDYSSDGMLVSEVANGISAYPLT